MTIIYYLLKMVMFILYYLYSNTTNIELIFTEFERLGVEKAIDLSRKTKKSYTIRYDYWNVICDFIYHNTDDSILLIGGSLYFISAIRRKLLEIIKNGRIKGR